MSWYQSFSNLSGLPYCSCIHFQFLNVVYKALHHLALPINPFSPIFYNFSYCSPSSSLTDFFQFFESTSFHPASGLSHALPSTWHDSLSSPPPSPFCPLNSSSSLDIPLQSSLLEGLVWLTCPQTSLLYVLIARRSCYFNTMVFIILVLCYYLLNICILH